MAERFGPYDLLAPLGHGGMGEVFIAEKFTRPDLPRVALKRIHADLAADAEAVARFTHEAKLAMMLTHAGVVKVHELGGVRGRAFMTLEMVPGLSLKDLATRLEQRDERLGVNEITFIILRVLDALQYVHEFAGSDGKPLALVHRDITPDNILLGVRGEVKIADFGVAKVADAPIRTQTGVNHGKPDYAAPEQASGETVDRTADIYAVGTILGELVLGRRLRGQSLHDLVAVESPGETALLHIARHATQREPSSRYQTALAFAEALRACAIEPCIASAFAERVARETPARALPPPRDGALTQTQITQAGAPDERRPTMFRAFVAFAIVFFAILSALALRPTTPPLPAPAVHKEPTPASLPAPAEAARTPTAFGALSLNAMPWSQVWIDGVAVGTTPLIALKLAPGLHRVRLRSSSDQNETTLVVTIQAGQSTSRFVKVPSRR
jgi:eukaryotic-like serine/threonine-protein kinase